MNLGGSSGNGVNGESGPAGAQFRFNAGVPASAYGNDGDACLDQGSGDVYAKAAGAWTLMANMRGSTGPAGATGAQGPKGDTGSTGPQGLQGATGSQGPVGNTGAQGIQGVAGATGAVGPTGPAGSDSRRKFFKATNVALNSVADTAFAGLPAKYTVENIWVYEPTGAILAATVAMYTGTGGSGEVVGAALLLTGLAATQIAELVVTPKTLRTATTVYFRVTIALLANVRVTVMLEVVDLT